jgi:glutamine amidotransferase
MITIVDYGVGNSLSVKNMIKRAGGQAEITGDLDLISKATSLIIPGVGNFAKAMLKLHESGLLDVLNEKVLVDKVPVLGICLGMQLLFEHSEEGDAKGLGWIPGNVVKFPEGNLKVPHMGWAETQVVNENALIQSTEEELRYYYVHSYYVKCRDFAHVITTANYGLEFHSAVNLGNIYGTQFHPEKSHRYGLQIMENYLKICHEN